jgi:Rrf2 family protein
MLRVNKSEDQALRLAMQLATSEGQLTLAELAARERLPEPTVAKLLAQLRRGRIVRAVRGRHGGYSLAAPATELSLASVLRAVGRQPAVRRHCQGEREVARRCPRLSDCGLRSVWRHVQLQVTDMLEATSLADLLHGEAVVEAELNHRWPAGEGARRSSRSPSDPAASAGSAPHSSGKTASRSGRERSGNRRGGGEAGEDRQEQGVKLA